MESTGIPGRVHVTRQTYERVYDLFEFDERKGVEVPGKGMLTTYVLKEKHHLPPIPKEQVEPTPPQVVRMSSEIEIIVKPPPEESHIENND